MPQQSFIFIPVGDIMDVQAHGSSDAWASIITNSISSFKPYPQYFPTLSLHDKNIQDNILHGLPDMFALSARHRQEDQRMLELRALADTSSAAHGNKNDDDDDDDMYEYDGNVSYLKTVDIIANDITPKYKPTNWLHLLSPLILPLSCHIRVNRQQRDIIVYEMDELHGDRYLPTIKGQKTSNVYVGFKDDPQNKIYPNINQLLKSVKPYHCNAWNHVFVLVKNPVDQIVYEVTLGSIRTEQGGPGFQRSSDWSVIKHNQIVYKSAKHFPPIKGPLRLLSD